MQAGGRLASIVGRLTVPDVTSPAGFGALHRGWPCLRLNRRTAQALSLVGATLMT